MNNNNQKKSSFSISLEFILRYKKKPVKIINQKNILPSIHRLSPIKKPGDTTEVEHDCAIHKCIDEDLIKKLRRARKLYKKWKRYMVERSDCINK